MLLINKFNILPITKLKFKKIYQKILRFIIKKIGDLIQIMYQQFII